MNAAYFALSILSLNSVGFSGFPATFEKMILFHVFKGTVKAEAFRVEGFRGIPFLESRLFGSSMRISF